MATLVCWFVYTDYRLNYWNEKVRQLCKEDGGLKVIERARVSPSEYASLLDASGEIGLKPERFAGKDVPFFVRDQETRLNRSSPEVLRREQQIVRRSDRKVIAVLRTYMRIGGDVSPVDNPSSFMCKPPDGNWFAQVISTVKP